MISEKDKHSTDWDALFAALPISPLTTLVLVLVGDYQGHEHQRPEGLRQVFPRRKAVHHQ